MSEAVGRGSLDLLARVHGSTVHRRRVRTLVVHLATLLPRAARVLDVGSGDGRVAALLMELRPDLRVEGVDVLARPAALIPTRSFDGRHLPFADGEFTAAMTIDVLHHADDPEALLREIARVTRECIVVKDHYRRGFAAQATLRLMDWVGNRAHGVALPFRYLAPEEWRALLARVGLRAEDEREHLGLYPVPASWLFDRGLHFVTRLRHASGEQPRPAPASAWERAYLVFERPEEARKKLGARLLRFGAGEWDRDARILELFAGSGYGLDAWTALGFRDVEGMDLSPELVARYTGPARCLVGDCRALPHADGSLDVVVVHGGLHHLETLADVARVLAEAHRVLAPGGRFLAVEPWRTPFLRAVLWAARQPLLRRAWGKLDAFQTMVENEQATYDHWLDHPADIERLLGERFEVLSRETRRGALAFHGQKRAAP